MPKPAVERENNVTCVCPGPDFESIYESSLPDFADVLELANTVDPPLVLMDLKHTNYCGSAFLGFLVRLSNRIAVQRNGRFGVCHLSKFVQTVVSASKMEKVFDVFETRDEGVAAYAGAASSREEA
jgi:anti-anti-sigma regulatory factor